MLSGQTSLLRVSRCVGYQRMTFQIRSSVRNSYAINAFNIEYSVTLYKGAQEIRFESDVEWDDYNHRMRVVFPLSYSGRKIYEIPYGWIERSNYESHYGGWADANGDWPAINWAGIDSDDYSVALFNCGTPSYHVEESETGDAIMLSLLRSPCIPTYLHEPESYSMVDWDHMRDAGHHHFSYALRAYDCCFADSTVVSDAELYVSGLVVLPGRGHKLNAPILNSDNVRISAVKRPEEGDGLVIRMCEYRGHKGVVKLESSENFQMMVPCNLLEKTEGEPGTEQKTRPFEILTYRITGQYMLPFVAL